MAGYVIVGALAAFGLLCVLWVLFGWLLTEDGGCAVVFLGTPQKEVFTRFMWLKSLGLLNCPLLAVTEEPGSSPFDEIEICSREALIPRLMEERNRFDGTGNGDHTGRHQCRGISEL